MTKICMRKSYFRILFNEIENFEKRFGLNIKIYQNKYIHKNFYLNFFEKV